MVSVCGCLLCARLGNVLVCLLNVWFGKCMLASLRYGCRLSHQIGMKGLVAVVAQDYRTVAFTKKRKKKK